MNKKKTLGAVISLGFAAFMLTASAPKAAAALSIPSDDGMKIYQLSNSMYATSLSSYDTTGNLLKEVTICSGATKCNKYYANGIIYSQIQTDDDAVYVIGQITTRAQSRNMQENFATVVVKYDSNLNEIWKKTYRVESSNIPQSSEIIDDVLYVTVKAGTNQKMGAYGQMCRYISKYSLAIDSNGVMTATKQ